MSVWPVVLILLYVGVTTPTDSGASACRDKDLVEKFVEYSSPDHYDTPSGLREVFRPHAAMLEGCLKRWVADGGEQDGVPLRGGDVNRETYRVYALSLLGQLYPRDAAVASWIRSNMAGWPLALQSQAVNTLGEIGVEESFTFLKAKARSADGQKREQIWWSLLLINGERFAEELESIAPTRDEQLAVGEMLMSARQRMGVPALRKLKTLVPERAAKYDEYIQFIEKSKGEAIPRSEGRTPAAGCRFGHWTGRSQG